VFVRRLLFELRIRRAMRMLLVLDAAAGRR
jgi:hypothetical protein